MRGTVRQGHFGGQWTEAGLSLNSRRTAKFLVQHHLRVRGTVVSLKLAH
jgi:hypothetical protein